MVAKASLDNLKKGKKFKKGESGNPNGRPKKLPQLDVLLINVLAEEKGGITAAETILQALRLKATKGNVHAASLLLDRAYGRAKQDIGIEIQAVEPITGFRVSVKHGTGDKS